MQQGGPHVSTRRFIEEALMKTGGFAPDMAAKVRGLIDNCRLHFYSPGDPLIRQETLEAEVFFVNHGVFKTISSDDDGNQTILSFSFRGNLLGEIAAIDQTPRSATVTAATDASILRLGGFSKISNALGTAETFQLLSRAACQRLRDLTQLHELILNRTAQEAVVAIVENVIERSRMSAQRGCRDLVIPLTQGDLSLMTGYRRETVNRIIKTAFGNSMTFTRSGLHIDVQPAG
ncbi:MAG: Crp/Fnr family transcriptional regulator [Pseudomonadota bacterium]